MIAAAYLRKSSDEGDKDEDAKSITRQLERCRQYAHVHGWTLPDEHVYADDGVSGAAFTRRERPAFFKLLDALEPRPPFQALIVSEQSRLGRATIRTLGVIQQIEDAGVEIHAYLDGRRITLAGEMDEAHSFLDAWASSAERKRASQRTRDALRLRAQRGYVAGGKAYGYRSVRTGDHTERHVDPAEARTVERIFTLCAQGHGLRRIARTLNDEGVAGPRVKRPWSVMSIKYILHNRLYLGEARFSRTRMVRQKGGQARQIAAPAAEHIAVTRSEWQIIAPEQWQAAHERLSKTREAWAGHRTTFGRLVGRPEAGLTARHLLSGFLRCHGCGQPFTPLVRTSPSGKVRRYWGCAGVFKRGFTTCPTRGLGLIPYDTLQEHILANFSPERVQALLMQISMEEPIGAWAFEYAERIPKARAEVAARQHEVTNLTDALRHGGDVKALVSALRDAERAHEAAVTRLQALEAPDEEPEVEEEEGWEEMIRPLSLTNSPAEGRRVLRQLIPSPLMVRPVLDVSGRLTGWQYEGEADFSGILARVPKGQLPRVKSR